MTKILISISDYYKDISKLLLDSAVSTLEKNSMNYEQIIVPGAFELASSINMGLETFEYKDNKFTELKVNDTSHLL